MFLVLVLTLSAGTLVSAREKPEPCPDTVQLTCGKTTYNPLSQSCCQGVVNSLANMTHPDCCGQKAYDRSTYLCCRHNAQADLTDISSMVRPKCCGIKAFDVTQQKCCSADVADSLPIIYLPQSQSCKHAAKVGNLAKLAPEGMSKPECGCGVTYDPKRQRCCPGNEVVDIPANTTRPHCCGKTVYDQHTHKCCNGKTYDISGTVQPSCCGPLGTFYDQSTELCCDGEKKYFHGLASPACCGKVTFDRETHSCADGKVSAKKGLEDAGIRLINPRVVEECPSDTFVAGFKAFKKPTDKLSEHFCLSPASGKITISDCHESKGARSGNDYCVDGNMPKSLCNSMLAISDKKCGLTPGMNVGLNCCKFKLDGKQVKATKKCQWIYDKVGVLMKCRPNELVFGTRGTTHMKQTIPAWGSVGIYCCEFEKEA